MFTFTLIPYAKLSRIRYAFGFQGGESEGPTNPPFGLVGCDPNPTRKPTDINKPPSIGVTLHKQSTNMASSSSFMIPFAPIALVFFLFLGSSSAQLRTGFYSSSCPNLFSTIRPVVESAIAKEKRMGASLLRLFFHDCFVNVHSSFLFYNTTLLAYVHIFHMHIYPLLAYAHILHMHMFLRKSGLRRVTALRRHLKLQRGEDRNPEQPFSARVWCDRQHKSCSGEGMPRGCVLCRHHSRDCKGFSGHSKLCGMWPSCFIKANIWSN